VAALRVLKARRIVGATYFPPALNAVFARYLKAAGFDVLGMHGIDVPFDKVQELASQQVYAHIKRNFIESGGADAIYMGSGWRTLDIIDMLEQDLQVPVVHPVTARAWEIQKRLQVRQPVRGFGRLLEALP
jgi:maleate isomerase